MSTEPKNLAMPDTSNSGDFIRNLRVRALMSNYFLVKAVLGWRDLVAHFHYQEMERFLQKWEEGDMSNWIEWPRGYFKTTCFTIGTSMWTVLPHNENDKDFALSKGIASEEQWDLRMSLHNPHSTHLLAFNNQSNAELKIGLIRQKFEEQQLFRLAFPEIAHTGKEQRWTNKGLLINRPHSSGEVVEAENTFDAIGVTGSLESRHYTHVWEDDLVDRAASKSPALMTAVIRWHDLLDGAFKRAAHQIRTGVSNRWGYNDLNSYVRKNDPSFVFHSRKAAVEDPETGKLVATVPELINEEQLAIMMSKGDLRRDEMAAQYFQSPSLPGQKELDLDDLGEWAINANGKIVTSDGREYDHRGLNVILGYDPYNNKGVNSLSCPALVAIGTTWDRKVLVLQYFTSKVDYSHIFDRIFRWNDRWVPYAFVYEDVGNQNMAAFHIQEMQKKPDFGFKHRIRNIIPQGVRGKSMESRVRSRLFPIIEAGRFYIRSTHLELRNQLETFPHSMPDHDYDVLDAIEDTIEHLRYPRSEEELFRDNTDHEKQIARIGAPYSHVPQPTESLDQLTATV